MMRTWELVLQCRTRTVQCRYSYHGYTDCTLAINMAARHTIPYWTCLMDTLGEILDEEDETEEECKSDDFPVLAVVISGGFGLHFGIRRMRAAKFAEHKVPYMSEVEFRSHFRLSRCTFQYICERLSLDLLPKAPGGFDVVPPAKQLLVFVHYLANEGTCIRTVAELFGIAESTVHKIVCNVSKAICCQRQKFIRWPNDARRRVIAAQFEEMSGIAGIVGAIDGTHIMVSNIKGGTADYFNRKKYPSVQLQLVVDDMLLINNSYVGWPGSAHDARVLRNSQFREKADAGELFGAGEFVIGDSAYPLKMYLIPVFRDNGHLTRQQKRFNTLISSCRQVVERAIGLLKCRFRKLQKVNCRNIKHICRIITAACVLHNMCILADDDVEIFVEEEDDVNGYENIFANDNHAEQFRQCLVDQIPY